MTSIRNAILDDILPRVQSPAQYVGAEWNMVRKDPARVALRFCFAFPDTYGIGMSHTGLQTLYGVLNERPDVYAERVFAPWTDMQSELRRRNVPLASLETFTPLREFDAVGFSLQYEMGFTNILDMLELAGIPLLSADRTPEHPLIVAGGPCAFNPEPLADFIDLFVVGDGEERILDLADSLIALKKERPRRREEALRYVVERVASVYAPALYREESDARGGTRVVPRTDLPAAPPPKVEAAIVADLDAAYVPERPIVPFVETVHDRVTIEIMRGCTRGCRFCHAGTTRRPVRWRSVEKIVEIAEKQYAATGHSEISLTSLSSSDYPELNRLVRTVAHRFAGRGVSVTLPSLRVSEQLGELPALLGMVRKSSLTIAPEAATDRLRRVINKEITEEDLYRGVEAAYQAGWQQVKLYFMVGLPTETDEDVGAIRRVAEEVSRRRRRFARSPARVNVSVAPFVPKPHTAFQWDPMAPLDRIEEIRGILRGEGRRSAVQIKLHRPERSFLEGVFARGDRRLGRVLLEAHRLGCRFDAWDECFRMDLWREAFSRAGVSPETYAERQFERGAPLPWSHIGAGVSDAFLLREREAAERGEFTTDCRLSECHGCGVSNCPNRLGAASATP